MAILTDTEGIKVRVHELVARHAPKAIDLARDILEHPETGFREFRTARLVAEFFDYLGLHTHPTFVLPQNVIPSGDLIGSVYEGAKLTKINDAPTRRPEGPEYVRTLKMRTVYRNTRTP